MKEECLAKKSYCVHTLSAPSLWNCQRIVITFLTVVFTISRINCLGNFRTLTSKMERKFWDVVNFCVPLNLSTLFESIRSYINSCKSWIRALVSGPFRVRHSLKRPKTPKWPPSSRRWENNLQDSDRFLELSRVLLYSSRYFFDTRLSLPN